MQLLHTIDWDILLPFRKGFVFKCKNIIKTELKNKIKKYWKEGNVNKIKLEKQISFFKANLQKLWTKILIYQIKSVKLLINRHANTMLFNILILIDILVHAVLN